MTKDSKVTSLMDDLKDSVKEGTQKVRSNVKEATHKTTAAVQEHQAETNAAKCEHEIAQKTKDPKAAMRAQQYDHLKNKNDQGIFESIKESLGKAGEAVKETASDVKDNAKQGIKDTKKD